MSALRNVSPAVEPPALSNQERAIQEGKKFVHENVTDRVRRMFEKMRAYGPAKVTLERSIYKTEAFKANEKDPLVLRWAKGMKNFVEKATVTIFDDELIVGRPNTWLGRWPLVYQAGRRDHARGCRGLQEGQRHNE